MTDTQATGPVTGKLVIRNGDTSYPVNIVLPNVGGTADLPVGTIITVSATSSMDSSWIKLDGSTYDQSVYPNLFGVLGTATVPNGQSTLDPLAGQIGVPIPFPSNIIPSGYMLCNGSSFDKNQYSQLAVYYPSGNVPDLRGLFIRGLDTTGNVDNYNGTRSLLSFEEGSLTFGEMGANLCGVSNLQNGFVSRLAGLQSVSWDAPVDQTTPIRLVSAGGGLVWSTGGQSQNANGTNNNEVIGVTRPKNMAFNYIVYMGNNSSNLQTVSYIKGN